MRTPDAHSDVATWAAWFENTRFRESYRPTPRFRKVVGLAATFALGGWVGSMLTLPAPPPPTLTPTAAFQLAQTRHDANAVADLLDLLNASGYLDCLPAHGPIPARGGC